MPLNRSFVALFSCNYFAPSLPVSVSALSSLTSSLGIRQLSPRITTRSHREHCKSYATYKDDGHASKDNHDVPEWPASQHPSPYEIFAIKKNAPYTKKRFYQLVKLYHPDKHHHHNHNHHHGHINHSASKNSDLAHHTRLERYRLVIAANDLLSDPTKRQLYDSYGVGWCGQRPQSIRETVRAADRSWRYQPGNAAHNATWEDWERWYAARDGKPRDPLYMSNGLFATIVVMMCMIGAFAQMERAEASGVEYIDSTSQASHAIGQQISGKTRSAAGMSKDQRVDGFLRDRENVAYDFVPGKSDDNHPDQKS